MSSVSIFYSTVNMHKVLVIVFCVGAAILSVKGDAIDQDMEEILRNTNDMLIKYDENLDKTVPFKELRASLKGLDAMAKDYHGESRDAIYSACDLGTKAADNYFRATDTIFTWCVKADRVISYLVKNKSEKKKKFSSLLRLTGKGVEAIKESLLKLEEVRSQLTDMSDKLRPVPSGLTRELAQLRKEHLERVAQLQKLKWGLTAALAIIGIVASIVLAFVAGPVGLAIGLTGTLVAAGVPFGVIKGIKEPSEEEKWKITEAYYMSLIQAVNYAQGNVTAVKDALAVEITHVNDLKGNVEGSLDLITDFEDDITNEELSDLSRTLKKFIERHGGGSESHRSRREAITYHGLDVDRISYVVDVYMNATVKEREAQFWTLPTLPVNPGVMSQMYKMAF